jgi:predicted transcriptional regulator
METTTIEVSNTTRNILQQLAAESGESIEVILEKAIEQYRRQWFLEAANKAYTALRNNPDDWAEEKTFSA